MQYAIEFQCVHQVVNAYGTRGGALHPPTTWWRKAKRFCQNAINSRCQIKLCTNISAWENYSKETSCLNTISKSFPSSESEWIEWKQNTITSSCPLLHSKLYSRHAFNFLDGVNWMSTNAHKWIHWRSVGSSTYFNCLRVCLKSSSYWISNWIAKLS